MTNHLINPENTFQLFTITWSNSGKNYFPEWSYFGHHFFLLNIFLLSFFIFTEVNIIVVINLKKKFQLNFFGYLLIIVQILFLIGWPTSLQNLYNVVFVQKLQQLGFLYKLKEDNSVHIREKLFKN
ncbi:hypothetical protein Mgra_00007319 [Meloidogyne graminicola]|uniref:Uncharacterized protein n=1 Tax=Meloidogyne graminicola TaxID=189291 RepID=A0A8S9ZJC3_9BILA|nr:hypothetical protein Mgra_00007319 [Meloidogyne graminicola]